MGSFAKWLMGFLAAGAALYGWASRGPTSPRARYRRMADDVLADPEPATILTEEDLAPLPEPVAAYVRRSGAVGLPRVTSFRARIHGRIRAGADRPWMPFTGEQVNTYGSWPNRLFFMNARMFGLPVDVFHHFVGPSATMEVKVCSLVPMADARGPEMDRSETVTIFNDMCVLAPAALVGAPIAWREIDDRTVEGTFTRGEHTVSARLVFGEDDRLVDFISDDRSRSSSDGTTFTPQRWSTPLRGYRSFGPRRIAGIGEARWHAPDPEGEFAYLEFLTDDILYNVGTGREDPAAAAMGLMG